MGPIDLTARLVAQVEIAKRSAYEVDCAGDKVYYVRDVRTPDGVEYEVNIKNDLKSVKCCPYITMHGLPCRHVVPVFFGCLGNEVARRVGDSSVDKARLGNFVWVQHYCVSS